MAGIIRSTSPHPQDNRQVTAAASGGRRCDGGHLPSFFTEAIEGPELTRIRVQLHPERPYGPQGLLTNPQSNGRFTLGGVPPESYRISVSGLPSGSYVKAVLLGRTELPDLTVDLSAAGAASRPGPLQIVVSRKDASVTGSAGDSKQGLLENLLVAAVRRTERGREYPDFFTTHTDRAGEFRWNNLAPGEWDFFAFEDSEAFHCLRGALFRRFLSKSKSCGSAGIRAVQRSDNAGDF